MKQLTTGALVLAGLLVTLPDAQGQAREEYEQRAREILIKIGRPQASIATLLDSGGPIVTFRLSDGAMVMMSRRLDGIVAYTSGRASVEATKSADQPPSLTVGQATIRARSLLPEHGGEDYEVTEATHYGRGRGELSGRISVRLYKRYFGHSTEFGDHVSVDYNARTGEVIDFRAVNGITFTRPPDQAIPEDEARATARAALERIDDVRVRDAAIRAWRAERPTARLRFDLPARNRADAHPTVRAWPKDPRLMWRIAGGGVHVTVDAETGLLNAVDWTKSAGFGDRPPPPATASTRRDDPGESTVDQPTSRKTSAPSSWLWALLAVPAGAAVWLMARARR